MCGRYYLESGLVPEEEILDSKLGEKMQVRLARPLTAAGEIRPGSIVPAIAPDRHGAPAFFPMLWGLFPGNQSGRPLINARVETAAVKPTYKDSWKRCRCAIPMSWYYEWQHYTGPAGKPVTGDKFLIRPSGAGKHYLAGLYRLETKEGIRYPAFTILTREPAAEIAFIHNRMPVIFSEEKMKDWISLTGNPEDLAAYAEEEMIFEKMDAAQMI